MKITVQCECGEHVPVPLTLASKLMNAKRHSTSTAEERSKAGRALVAKRWGKK